MRRLLLLSLVMFVFSIGMINAQSVKKTPTDLKKPSVHRCGTVEHNAALEAADPTISIRKQQLEEWTQKWIAEHPENDSKVAVTIPVVFHVLWKTSAQNISDVRIQEQLDALNRDFAGLNTHSMGQFSSTLKANTQIQFCLAQRTPAGLATNGIERIQTTVTSFSQSGDPMKHASSGGADAWDPTKYFNIWVCNLSGGLLGYAQFPSSGINSNYGVVLLYSCVGTTGVSAPYNLGASGTHEIGHCFNLYHIWGDDGTACSGSDLCTDTPNQAGEHYNINPPGNGVLTDNCTSTSPGVMYMNFMDYTDDVWMANFTPNQNTRMQALFASGGALYSLTTSNGCTPVSSTLATLTTNSVTAITNTTATCGGNITSQGSGAVTARGVCWSTSQNPVATGLHTTNGTGTGTFTSNITGLTLGTTYYVRAYATNASGTAYGNQVSFTTTGGTTPACDTLSLMTTGQYWYSYANGNNSYFDKAKVNYFASTTSGQTIQDVYIQFIYGVGSGNATVSVWNNSGTGGSPGTTLGSKTVPISTIISDVNNQQMTSIHFTNPISLTGPCYIGVTLPTAAGDTVVLLADTSSSSTYNVAWEQWSDNVWYAYDHANSWGIETALAVFPVICNNSTEVSAINNDFREVSVYPNPSQNFVFCDLGKLSAKDVKIIVYNMLGKEIVVKGISDSTGKIKLDFSNQSNGIYFIHFDSPEGKFIRKVSINK